MKIIVAETFSVKTCLIGYRFRIGRYSHDIIYLMKVFFCFCTNFFSKLAT